MDNHFGLEVFDSYSMFKNQYMCDRMIIETNLSVVYEVIDTEGDRNRRYALKVIPIDIYKRICDKLSLSFAISHSNIITTFTVLFDSDSNPKFAAYLMELGYGDLITLQDQIIGSEIAVKKIIYDSLKGLKYLHEYHICHLNIKPENIIAKSYQEPRTYAICDFSCAMQSEDDIFKGPFRGTPIYSAPEKLNNSQCTNKVDIWSLGVVMYTFLTGRLPFNVENANISYGDLRIKIFHNNPINFEHLSSFSEDAIDLISSMLQMEPKNRISAADALQHRWFTNDPQLVEINASLSFNNMDNPINNSEHDQILDLINL